MEDSKRFDIARAANLGKVNHAFLTSIDEGDRVQNEISLKVISLSSDGNSLSSRFASGDCHEDESCLSSSPVLFEKHINEDKGKDSGGTDEYDTSFIDGKSGIYYDEATNDRPYGETSCQASQPNQPHQCFDLDPNNSSTKAFNSSCDDLVKTKTVGRMEEGWQSHNQIQENSSQPIKQEERTKGVSPNEFTTIDLGPHKDEIQAVGESNEKSPDNSTAEVADLNLSVRSDATEFFYTPEISPTRSPVHVERKRGVKFSEKSVEIGQDMLETSFDHFDDNHFAEERVVGCLDQEYLRRMVDPNSQFFVRKPLQKIPFNIA